MKAYKRRTTRHGGLTTVSQAKLRNNTTVEVGHGQRNASGILAEIEERTALFYQHNPRKLLFIPCPKCHLVTGRRIVLPQRKLLHDHLLDHRIQHALGCEKEWVERHTTHTLWSQHPNNEVRPCTQL